jgi:hypothetical protein
VSVKTRVSLFILLVLGLHAIPVLFYQGVRQTRWPFLLWAMYAQSTPPGPIQALTRRLYAVTPGGTAREITSVDVGLTLPGFASNYLAPISRGDTAAGRWVINRLHQVGMDSVVQLRLVTARSTLVDTGIAVDTLPVVVYPPTLQSPR